MARRWFDTGADTRLRLEPCSAVATGICCVHRGGPGRLAECPTAAVPLYRPDHALRASPVGHRRISQQTLTHGSKLRVRVTWARKTVPAWPDPNRRSNHPASPHRLLVCNLAFGAAMGESTTTASGGDKPAHF